MIDQILQFLGGATVAAGIAFLLFRYLGKSWIESKFSERLEQFKHQQALEIQRLRIEIDSTLSGVLKIQEKEFETLPEAWCKLDEAVGRVSALVSPIQQYPNLDRMTPAQVEEVLADLDLRETEKQTIRLSREKVQTYKEVIFWHRLHKVKKACSDLHGYVVRYGIFFPPDVKEKFTKVAEELWDAVSYKEAGEQEKDYKIQNDAWQKIKDEIYPLFKAIESDIHARLQSHGRSQ